jgi:nucleoside-diphosphate-sugar epimerase
VRVFLTGGTGGIGSHIAERLRADGHEIVALVRPASDRRFLERLGARLVEGDVCAPERYRGALRGCDAVVHAAAYVVQRARWEEYRRVNVEGTRYVLEAAAAAGVSRALLVSSVSVYGGLTSPDGRVTEETPTDAPLPDDEVYARSKRMAEEVAWSLHRAGAIDLRVVRPSVNYGDRDRILVPRLARYLSLPVTFLVGRGDNTLPVIYLGNTADGAVLALTRPEASGRAYNLADDFPVTQRAFFEGLARAIGRRPRFLRLPAAAAYALGALFERLPFGLAEQVGLNRRRIAFLVRPNPFVAERARRELGWAPRVPPEEAIRRAGAWYCAAYLGARAGAEQPVEAAAG